MTRLPEEIEVGPAEIGAVVTRAAELVAAHRGWVNVQPMAERDDEPERPGLLSLFTNRMPSLALGTLTPPPARRPDDPCMVGISHPAAGRAVPRLAEVGLAVPAGWRVVQDSPRRGLVLRVPADADLSAVFEWLLPATVALTPKPTSGRWVAAIHAGR